jgi:protoporphyrinogen oxidase
MDNVIILGAGMAGFGAAHRLFNEGIKPLVLEKEAYHGGHTASFKFDEGFVFDCGPHISFTKNDRIKKLFAESVQQEFQENNAYVNNYWKGYWIKHPAQCNLYGLPTNLVRNIICDFVDANGKDHQEIQNYEDWLRASFGDTFANTFPMEYTIKYHTTTANNMSTDWIAQRLYRPKLEEIIQGALEKTTSDIHYITTFRYPTWNGFVSFLNLFLPRSRLCLNHEVVRIDTNRKLLSLSGGKEIEYDDLISSIPLPELIPLISGTPNDVKEAARRLACTEVVVVSLGINRSDIIDAHWTYFYDRDIFFTRLSTPHLQSPNNVPNGCSSLQAECYFSKKYRPLDRSPEDCIEPVIRDLQRCNILKEEDKIIFKKAMHFKYANVIFDLERKKNLELVHGYLDDLGIACCGRYGLWAYIWTDQSFLSGEIAAQKILDKPGRA